MPFFGRERGRKGTRIFYATDVHGSERTWRKFLNAGAFYGADALVMGGDVMGKLTIPIINEGNGHHRATIHGRIEHAETAAEVETMRGRIADLGFYHTTIEEDRYLALRADPGAVEGLFVELASERLARWIDLAESRLAGTGIRCYATGGNDDLTEVVETMNRTDTQAF
ncbi:MAG: metallophosphoesterase family protein, partial [Candidatus Limnocylindrales bacterium]